MGIREQTGFGFDSEDDEEAIEARRAAPAARPGARDLTARAAESPPVLVKRRPRGNARGRQEVEENLDKVTELMSKGTPTNAIIRIMGEDGGPARATVVRYMATVRERWLIERQANRETCVEARIERLTRLIAKYEDDGEIAAVVQLEKHLTDVMGAKAPERVDVRAQVAHAVVPTTQVDMSEWPDDVVTFLKQKAQKMLELAPPAEAPPPDVVDAEVVDE